MNRKHVLFNYSILGHCRAKMVTVFLIFNKQVICRACRHIIKEGRPGYSITRMFKLYISLKNEQVS